MPARLDHEAMLQPVKPSTPVWRYLDIPRLIQLLDRRALYLCRLDLLGDPAEGHFPPHMRRIMQARWRVDPRPIFVQNNSQLVDFIEGNVRTRTFVNCWCLQEHESEALWKRYGGTAGVAIRSTYQRLTLALEPSVFVGAVTYLDYSREGFEEGNALTNVMHKRREFAHESEVRIVEFWPQESFGRKAPTGEIGPVSPCAGIWRSVDLACLDAVVTSPDAPPWVDSAIRSLVSKYAPSLPVERSSMVFEPRIPDADSSNDLPHSCSPVEFTVRLKNSNKSPDATGPQRL